MYLAILLFSIIFACIAYLNPRWDSILFKIEYFVLTCFICFRYGQGTDYFSYEIMYRGNMTGFDMNWLLNSSVHGEFGYKILQGISKYFNLSFVTFLGIISLIMMIWTYKGIERYSNLKTLSIALFIPTYYFSYYIGIVREGFALAAALGVLLPLYIGKLYTKYLFVVFFLCGIHRSALILLVPIVAEFFKKIQGKSAMIVLGILSGGVVGAALYLSQLKRGYMFFSPSYGAIVIRIILFYIITRLYRYSDLSDDINKRLYNFYFVGFVLFMSTCSIALMSHRLTAYMKIVEIILLPRLIMQASSHTIINLHLPIKNWKNQIVLFLFCMLCVEGIKNIDSYISQGQYYDSVQFYNFPYVTVFNQEDIYKHRFRPF